MTRETPLTMEGLEFVYSRLLLALNEFELLCGRKRGADS